MKINYAIKCAEIDFSYKQDANIVNFQGKFATSYEKRKSKARMIHCSIGLLQLAVTWYKTRHAGEQASYYSRTGTAKQCYFILSNLNFLCFGCPSAGIIISLLSSMADFVPCDR